MTKRTKDSLRDLVIKQLNERFCKFVNVQFGSDIHGYVISQGSREAINSYDNDRELVQATQWFDDTYWFFIRIQFVLNKKHEMKPYASVSFFQEAGDRLKQLFRAEWDSYPPEEEYSHPQPHWHFTAQLSDKSSFSDLDGEKGEEEESIFSELVGNSKTIHLDRMHFAMSGNWPQNGSMINVVGDEIRLVDWLIYLFRHVREELEYKEREKEA